MVTWIAVDKVTATSWSAVDDVDDISWLEVIQSGTVAAQFELNEPLGGPYWEPVEKDT